MDTGEQVSVWDKLPTFQSIKVKKQKERMKAEAEVREQVLEAIFDAIMKWDGDGDLIVVEVNIPFNNVESALDSFRFQLADRGYKVIDLEDRSDLEEDWTRFQLGSYNDKVNQEGR